MATRKLKSLQGQQERYRAKHGPEIKETLAQWYATRGRARHLLKTYGITLAQYDALLQKQDGACAICRTTDPGGQYGRFHVDHDHTTKAIRGLLCNDCNLGLGVFKDRVDVLAAALTYLTKTSAEPAIPFSAVAPTK